MARPFFVYLSVWMFLFGRAAIKAFVLQSSPRLTTSQTQLHGVRQFLSNLVGRNRDKENPTKSTIQDALLRRRTVNNFETKSVSREIVNQALEAAVHAPCHKMTEPWRFILLGNETIREIAALNAVEIAKKDPAKGAKKQARWQAIPGWCVVTSAKSPSDPVQQQEDYAATACAVQNFMLSLWDQGVGTKWTSGPITRTSAFADLCGIDLQKEQVVGCIWFGYAQEGLDSIPAPRRKRSLEEVVSWQP